MPKAPKAPETRLALLLHGEFCDRPDCEGVIEYIDAARRLLPKITAHVVEAGAKDETEAAEAAEDEEALPVFMKTWPAFARAGADTTRRLDTETVRRGWPKPTLYREHEIIHLLCHQIDLLRAEADQSPHTLATTDALGFRAVTNPEEGT